MTRKGEGEIQGNDGDDDNKDKDKIIAIIDPQKNENDSI